MKRPGLPSQEIDDKISRIQSPQEPKESLPVVKRMLPGDDVPYDPAMPVFSDLTAISASSKAPDTTNDVTGTTPLQTILKTLFGSNKQSSSDLPKSTSEPKSGTVKKPLVLTVPMVDPIVQRYQQTSKMTSVTKEDFRNDQPYDPEEEYEPTLLKKPVISFTETHHTSAQVDDDRPYDPEEEYNFGNTTDAVISNTSCKTEKSGAPPIPKDDVAYDPEDNTVFEEVQNYLAVRPAAENHGEVTPLVSEQQKMLDDLNRQIEEQKRLLAEQEEILRLQREAVGVSMAHFSVSDALMSPPPSFGHITTQSVPQEINSSHDPRWYSSQTQTSSQSSILSKNDQENTSDTKWKGSSDKQTDSHSTAGSSSRVGRSHSPSRSSSRSRRSDVSRRDRHGSSERRSRDERRLYDRKNSHDSKDDRHCRRSRRSPEKSRRSRSRSRSRSSRRVTSSQRHRRQNTLRHEPNQEICTSLRTSSGRFARPEKADPKDDKSGSRKSKPSIQGVNLDTSEKPQTLRDEAGKEAAETPEQTGCVEIIKSKTDQSDEREEPVSNPVHIDHQSQDTSDQQQSETKSSHQTNDRHLIPVQEKKSEDKSLDPQMTARIQMDDLSESENYQKDLPQTTLNLENPTAPEPSSINHNPPNTPQNDTFREVGYQNLPQPRADPRGLFRLRAPDLRWRLPQQNLAGPRCRIPLQPRMLRPPHHQRFESHGSNYAGARPRLGAQHFGPREQDHTFEGFSHQLSGPKARFQSPGVFEDPRFRRLRQRATSSDSGVFDCPYDYPTPPQGSADDFNNQRKVNAQQLKLDISLDLNQPKGQLFTGEVDRESQPSEFDKLREHTRLPFKPSKSDNTGFKESRFSNLPPHRVRRQNPECESSLFTQSEEPQLYQMESQMEQGPDPCRTEHSADGGRMEAQMKRPRFNPPANFRLQRAPLPHFHGQRMPAPQHKDNLPSLMDFSLSQRPKPGQNQIRFDAPPGKPSIQPLRLSGPLLPTPSAGPLRFYNPRMPRPCPYDRLQNPPARGPISEAVNPGCLDDRSRICKGETSQDSIPDEENEEYEDDGEEFSAQDDNSPGKQWLRRSKRKRRRRRRQRFRIDEGHLGQGPDEGTSCRDFNVS